MNDDILAIYNSLQILVSVLLVTIAVVAFRYYVNYRNWKLLGLSISYSLWAVVSIIHPILIYALPPSSQTGDIDTYIQTRYTIESIFAVLTFLAYGVLAYVYYSERKVKGIKITKLRWIVGVLVAIFMLGLLAYSIYNGRNDFDRYPVYILFWLLFVGSVLFEIYIIISLYSYYKYVGNKNTLIVMAGFVSLLAINLVPTFIFVLAYFDPRSIQYLDTTPINIIAILLAFAGYALFLVALIRLKRS